MSYIRYVPGGVRVQIYVQPGARRTEIVGLHDGALKIKIKSPPEDGRANAELCEFLAKICGVAKSLVHLESGAGSRKKVVVIEGASESISQKLAIGMGC